jgi:transposase
MKCKKTIDARSYTHDMLEKMRRDAVKRVASGESPEGVASGLGINRRTIYRWLTAYHYGGDDALGAKAIPGAPPKLNAKQLAKLANVIRNKNPQQLKFDYALWTLAIIRQVIVNLFGVKLSEVSVGRLMKRLGFTPQRPLYRAWQQNPELVKTWQNVEYPKIVRRAKKENALIFFADEAGIRSDNHAGTTWAPSGQTPVVKATGARFGFNMLSAVNALGHFRFMTHEGTVTGGVFRDFLKRLMAGMERKIFLIVDGHPTHKAKLVKQFLADNAARIELFFLPPYSPELNPDELVWNNVKARVAKMAVMTKEDMKAAADSALRRLQKLPAVVASFFRTPTCKYAVA